MPAACDQIQIKGKAQAKENARDRARGGGLVRSGVLGAALRNYKLASMPCISIELEKFPGRLPGRDDRGRARTLDTGDIAEDGY